MTDPNGPVEDPTNPQPGRPAPPPPDDGSGDTQMFRAFVEQRDEPVSKRPVGASFALLTLLGGLVAFALIAFLVLRL